MCGSSYQPITRSGPVPRFAAIAALGRTSSQVMYSTLTAAPVASWNFFVFAFQASSSALMNPLHRSSRSCASFSTGNIGAYFAAGAWANERVAAPAASPRPHFMKLRRSVMAIPPSGAAILVPARARCQSAARWTKKFHAEGAEEKRESAENFSFEQDPPRPPFPRRPLRETVAVLTAAGAREPGETFVRSALRAVLQADGAAIAQFVEVGEECGDGLLAGARLVAARHVGDLHVPDPGEVAAQHGARILAHHAGVVLVELEAHVRRVRRVDQVDRHVRCRSEVAGHVDGVDVLDEQGEAGLRHQRRGGAQVRDGGPAGLLARDARRRDAGERVQPARPEPLRRGDRVAHGLQEFRLAAGQGEKTALSLPPVARPRVEEHQLEAQLAERTFDGRRIQLVDEQDLHSPEPRLGRSPEPIQDRQLLPEHGQVGGEARHPQLRGLSTVTPAASSQRRTSEAMSFSPIPRARASRKRCSATAPRKSGTFAAFASSWISPRSLRSSVMLVAGPKSREMKRGRFRVIMVEPPKEVPITSSTTRGSAPSFAPNTAASATAAVWTPTSSWLMSFTTCPAPAGPHSLMFLPKVRKTGCARCIISRKTCSTASGVGSAVSTISARSATSAAEEAGTAPLAASSSTGARERLKTCTSNPAPSRRTVIGRPILPRPMNPTFMAMPGLPGYTPSALAALARSPWATQTIIPKPPCPAAPFAARTLMPALDSFRSTSAAAPARSDPSMKNACLRAESVSPAFLAARASASESVGTTSICAFPLPEGNAVKESRLTPASLSAPSTRTPSPGLSGTST